MIIIDRFEGSIAVLENGDEFMEIERNLISIDAKEGDVVELHEGKYVVKAEKTAQRRSDTVSRLRRMGL